MHSGHTPQMPIPGQEIDSTKVAVGFTPSSGEWEHGMNETIWKEKTVHVRQGCIKKYEEIWKPYWDVKG